MELYFLKFFKITSILSKQCILQNQSFNHIFHIPLGIIASSERSPSLENCLPFIFIFTFRNSTKSQGAKHVLQRQYSRSFSLVVSKSRFRFLNDLVMHYFVEKLKVHLVCGIWNSMTTVKHFSVYHLSKGIFFSIWNIQL